MLSESEKVTMALDIAELIRMSGQTAEIRRGEPAGAGSFEGVTSPEETLVAVVPIEFQSLSPEELKQIGADGLCSMLPNSGVREGDLVVFDDVRFVVSDVRAENCFGAVTHLTVRLEREYQQRP